jgi:hypothetical protein
VAIFAPSGVVGIISASNDTVNVNVVAVKAISTSAMGGASTICLEPKRRELLIEDWLHAVGYKEGRDPLDLLSLHSLFSKC